MQPFVRALRDGLRYWHLLLLALACSAGSAFLWGMNIAALFPIIEVTLHGKSLSEWNLERNVQSAAAIAKFEARIGEIEASDPQAEDLALQTEKDALGAKISLEQAHQVSTARMQPIFERYLPSKPFGTIILVAVMITLATLGKHLFGVTNTFLVGYVSARIGRDIRSRLFDRAITLDRRSFQNTGTAGYATNITSVADGLAGGIANFYGGAVTEPLKILVCLGGAWFIAWRLTLCSLLIAPVVAILITWLNRRIKTLARTSLERSVGMYHVILETLSNHLTVQAFTMEDFERERFQKSTGFMMKHSMTATFFHSLTGPITELLGMGMICTSIVVGSYLVMNQQTHVLGIRMVDRPLSVSSLMVFFGMLIGASDPVRKLSGIIMAINTGSVAAKSLYGMIDAQTKIESPAEPREVPRPHRTIELRDVSFSYDGKQTVLNHVSETFQFGQCIAIVGPNGGGKSTLVNLLCRFYDPTEGQVLMDGVPLTEMSLKDLRGRISLVTQHTEIFDESVMFNIRYGRLDATDEEVIDAARKAYADTFVSNMPDKYETIVGPGGQRLSGGQRQRIVLARALLRNPEILILDEATSQIDVESEELIHAALSEFAKNRTVFMITHRESTLALADQVLEIRHGNMKRFAVERKKAG